jgi:hypothetical protein
MKKVILAIAIISLIYSCTPAVKEGEGMKSIDSLALSVDTLAPCADTVKCDTVCTDTTLKK